MTSRGASPGDCTVTTTAEHSGPRKRLRVSSKTGSRHQQDAVVGLDARILRSRFREGGDHHQPAALQVRFSIDTDAHELQVSLSARLPKLSTSSGREEEGMFVLQLVDHILHLE
jgi:hypothetical protein